MLPVRLTGCFGGPRSRLSLFEPLAEVDRVFDSVFGDRQEDHTRVDLREDEGHYYVDADVPGFEKADIAVTFEDGVLTVAGKRNTEQTREGENCIVRERQSGSFTRSVRMPNTIKEGEIDASLINGVLTIKLPKADEIKPRRIEVKG